MDYKDAIEEIRKHITVLNDEEGQIRDCIAKFKTENAEFHGEMKSDIDWIKKGIWAIFVPLLLLIVKSAIDIIGSIK